MSEGVSEGGLSMQGRTIGTFDLLWEGVSGLAGGLEGVLEGVSVVVPEGVSRGDVIVRVC